MIQRSLTVDGVTWSVTLAGRTTAYERDEYPVVFERRNAAGAKERRLSRFSPLGARSRERALGELSERDLRTLFAQSQPAWTSPELGYARG